MVDYEFTQDDVFPSYIESERIEFIPIHRTDLSVRTLYQRYSSIPEENTAGVTFDPYETMKEAKDFLEESQSEFEDGENAAYLMKLSETDEWIGVTNLVIKWDRKIAESGIYIFEEYWGNGYGTERGETMVEVAFEEYNIDFWVSQCAVDNKASQNSIEKYVVGNGGSKYGRVPNKPMGDTLKDLYKYVLKRTEYESE
jgi:RimJ/RimL family protein N-acetyltransferase